VDERGKHLRQLQRLRRSARGWSVRAGLLAGAAAVLVPYHGLGLPDAAWAAAACGSTALAAWRWTDLRALARRPIPPPRSPEELAAQSRAKMINAVRRLPVGGPAGEDLLRLRDQLRMRGTAAAGPWRRLDRASQALAGLRSRLGGPAASAIEGADAAEHSLRELAERTASIERAGRMAPGGGSAPLAEAGTALAAQLAEGVHAYEQLVAAAATYVAADTRLPGPVSPQVQGLTDAAELLRCVAESLSEFRRAAPS
jgi:hypothetical protein